MVDSCLDAKMDHFLTHYFLAKGNGHEIQKMFSENDFYDLEEFTSCDEQSFVGMERKKGGGMTGFNDRKITLIHSVVLYYHFLRSDNTTKVLAKDPENWVVEDFKT